MIKLISSPISLEQLKKEAQTVFGDMVKAVVDIQKHIMVINGELHADEEKFLLKQGSEQGHLWGINLYPELYGEDDWIEFDSMINLRPSVGNNSRGVENQATQGKIRQIVNTLIKKE